jgi:hypothetical protein
MKGNKYRIMKDKTEEEIWRKLRKKLKKEVKLEGYGSIERLVIVKKFSYIFFRKYRLNH